jgi:hypothetical protein
MPGKNGQKNGKDDRKNNIIKCKAFTGKKGNKVALPCYKYVECDNCKENKCDCGKSQKYCNFHLYFDNFTDDDIDHIKNEDETFYICSSCLGWRTKDKCYHCLDKRKSEKEAKKKGQIECDVLKSDGTKCTMEMHEVKDGKNICKMHLRWDLSNLQFYENKDNLKYCSGCNKYKKNTDFKDNKITCIECNEISKNDREKKIKKIEKFDICKVENCNNYAFKYKSEKKQKELINELKLDKIYGNYCRMHQLIGWKKKIEKDGNKLCQNYIRGCRDILDLHDLNTYCNKCREKRRNEEKARREKEKELNKDADMNVNAKKKICVHCPKSNNMHPIEEFIEGDKECSWCIKCRMKAREQDNKRGKRNRNYAEYDKRPEVKERKKEWKENNKDKFMNYWRKSRANRRNKLGDKDYLKKIAEQAKIWRDRNPEKLKNINEKRRRSMKVRFNIYKMSAKKRNLEFKLTEEQCYEFFKSKCKKCGGENQDGLLCGIDRVKNDVGYIYENCEACCTICNMIKCDILDECLMRKIEHILNYLGLIETNNYYPDDFEDHVSGSFSSYKKRAEKKNLPFELSSNEFLEITLMDCYLCGKKTEDNNLNGIDRIDSDKNAGYIFGNIVPCCADCNYMKNKYDLNIFISKIYEMYIMRNNIDNAIDKEQINNIINEYIEDIKKEIKVISNEMKNSENKDKEKNNDEPKEKKIKKIEKIEKKEKNNDGTKEKKNKKEKKIKKIKKSDN